MVGSDELLGHKYQHGVEHDTSRPDGSALGDMLTMLQERAHSKKVAAAATADAGATTAAQDQLVTTASAATVAAGATAPRRRIIVKSTTISKNAIINEGPPAGAAPIVVKFGCSKCRGGKKGCIQCRNPNFVGKRFTKA